MFESKEYVSIVSKLQHCISNIHTHRIIYVKMYIYVRKDVHICTYMYTYMYIYVHVKMYIYVHICTLSWKVHMHTILQSKIICIIFRSSSTVYKTSTYIYIPHIYIYKKIYIYIHFCQKYTCTPSSKVYLYNFIKNIHVYFNLKCTCLGCNLKSSTVYKTFTYIYIPHIHTAYMYIRKDIYTYALI